MNDAARASGAPFVFRIVFYLEAVGKLRGSLAEPTALFYSSDCWKVLFLFSSSFTGYCLSSSMVVVVPIMLTL